MDLLERCRVWLSWSAPSRPAQTRKAQELSTRMFNSKSVPVELDVYIKANPGGR